MYQSTHHYKNFGPLDRLSKLEEEASTSREAITDAEEQFANFDERYAEMGKKIEEALLLGNREDLQQQYSQVENNIRTVNAQQESVRKGHSELFSRIVQVGEYGDRP